MVRWSRKQISKSVLELTVLTHFQRLAAILLFLLVAQVTVLSYIHALVCSIVKCVCVCVYQPEVVTTHKTAALVFYIIYIVTTCCAQKGISLSTFHSDGKV